MIKILNLLFQIFQYFRHDKELKNQQETINNMEIERLRKEAITEKQASLSMKIVREGEKLKLVFINTSKVEAKSVRIDVLNKKDFLAPQHLSFGPYNSIPPMHSHKENLFILDQDPRYLILRIKWDDDYASDREYEQLTNIE